MVVQMLHDADQTCTDLQKGRKKDQMTKITQ